MEESYVAEEKAEKARAVKSQATLEADVIVKADIDKKQQEIAAEAQAEQLRRIARGEADAIYAKMEAEARGQMEILLRQAQGFEKLVASAGGDANDAVKLIIADKLEEIVKIQVEAIKNIKFDKVTVWDSGSGKDGNTSTANFLSNLMKSIPPMNELFQMAGMQLPDFLGKDLKETGEAKTEMEQLQPVEKETDGQE